MGLLGEVVMRWRVVASVGVLSCAFASAANAQGCTPNHELYRVVPEFRAIMLDGGEIKRVLFVDWKDERLNAWKPGNNITFCPNQNKVINTSINSIATLLPEMATSCDVRGISDEMDSILELAWKYPSRGEDASLSVVSAESKLGWYYEVCADHVEGFNVFKKKDLKEFLFSAASLSKINMAIEDPVNGSLYKARAAKYEKWNSTLYEMERNKSWTLRIWEWWSKKE
jgi:hypothetical protein